MIDLSSIKISQKLKDVSCTLVRPGLSIFLYCDELTPVLAPNFADLLEAYLAVIPQGSLRAYLANNGQHKPITLQQINRDLKLLRMMPTSYRDFRLRYSESPIGDAGTYSISYTNALDARNQEEKVFPLGVNLITMEFPLDFITNSSLEAFLDLIIKLSQLVPFQTGNVGYAFQRSSVLEESAAISVIRLMPRFWAFDPSRAGVAYRMKGRTIGAHWINLLNDEMVNQLGGIQTIKVALPSADIRSLKNGTLIRGAKRPPIGDVNRGASDIGTLPDVARLLRPIRYETTGFGIPAPEFDAMAWLARYDSQPSRPWDNE